MAEFRANRNGRLTAMMVAVVLCCVPAIAQDVGSLETRRAERTSEYQRVLDEIALTQERQATLADEVAEMRKDNAAVTAALIQAAKTEKKLATDAAAIEDRLIGLKEQEDSIRVSLHARRGVLAEVLGALQRMGLNPPPAILVKPEDALSSVRSAIVLGAVVPELRAETAVLLGDLKELARLRQAIAGERDRLRATAMEQAAEKHRLSLLLEEKRKLLDAGESDLASVGRKAGELAARAGSLKELIDGIETEIAAVKEAAEEARRAEEERLRREAEALGRPIPEQNRLTASIPFESLAGKVPLPAVGSIVRRFGEPDGLGAHMLGDTVQTQSGAIVTAPADAGVLYAGPFRSYGQLLILDAGDGYHIVLAGLGKISVSPGQSVLAGEPVGAMGETRLASAVAFGGAGTSPELYVEVRKSGKPVDPARWWAERSSGRTKDDS